MSELNYGRMMQRAMQGLMAEALSEVSEHGLPGDHHFYISFLTQHPGVDIPDSMRERFPKEMMIVLQHEFSDLAVTQDRFSVCLSFDNRPYTIVVPFDAVSQFADPSAEFGLRFDPTEAPEDGEFDEDEEEEEAAPRPAEVLADLSRRRTGQDNGDGAEEVEEDDPEGDDKPSGDVVSLDSFRKK